ncbi:hypothetical protein C8R43DRAFT_251617 [Mycena crocata]|nr:hypothetical protein C8R43DRAFT_251617 [Mycena crocata]
MASEDGLAWYTLAAPKSPDVFEPSMEDLLAARDVLLRLCPVELVYLIFDLAAYWGCVKSTQTDLLRLSASESPGHDGVHCYIVTAPILETRPAEDVHLKLMSVRYVTLSHDQGWSDVYGTRGTYQGRTWFEAAILRPSQLPADSVDLESWLERAVHSPTAMDADEGYDSTIEVKRPEKTSRWMVQMNFVASLQFRQHSVIWYADGSVTPESGQGRGDGSGFVENLAAGDRIALIARATTPGRRNIVECAEVTVYYALI